MDEISNFSSSYLPLNKSDKDTVKLLFNKYKHIFDDDVETIPGYTADFKIEKPTAHKGKIYPIPHKYQAEVDTRVTEMLSTRCN